MSWHRFVERDFDIYPDVHCRDRFPWQCSHLPDDGYGNRVLCQLSRNLARADSRSIGCTRYTFCGLEEVGGFCFALKCSSQRCGKGARLSALCSRAISHDKQYNIKVRTFLKATCILHLHTLGTMASTAPGPGFSRLLYLGDAIAQTSGFVEIFCQLSRYTKSPKDCPKLKVVFNVSTGTLFLS